MKKEAIEASIAIIAILLLILAIVPTGIDLTWRAILYFIGLGFLFYIDYKWNTPAQQRKYPSSRRSILPWFGSHVSPPGNDIDHKNRP